LSSDARQFCGCFRMPRDGGAERCHDARCYPRSWST
jgi:hypothetical protein